MQTIAKRYFEGIATESELEQLLEWLRKKDNRSVFHSFRLDWEKSLEHESFPGGGEESWNRLQAKLWQKSHCKWQKTRKIHQFFRYAAIFFFVLSIGSLVWYFSHQPDPIPETYTTVAAEKGHISKVELPDGSLVWVNSGSQISYNNFYFSSNRKVALTGEAYFDVVKNEITPLIVDCGEISLKVTGTSFNVNAYSWEKHIELVLEEGKVELVNSFHGHSYYKVKPGERVRFDRKDRGLSIAEVNTARYTSWKDGIINFYDLPMEEVAMRLETRYNQKFELHPGVKDLRYTFTIKNEPLHEIINLMKDITPIKAEQKEDIITISADKDKMREAER